MLLHKKCQFQKATHGNESARANILTHALLKQNTEHKYFGTGVFLYTCFPVRLLLAQFQTNVVAASS